jgi:uncharacterized membrane protein YdjX (TVP38/TMEM64 family)
VERSGPRRWRLALLIALIAVGVAAFALGFVPLRERLGDLVGRARTLDPAWVFPVAGLFVPFCVLWLPGIWVTFFCCLAWGFWPTFPAIVLASNLGAAAAFGLGRTLLAERVRTWCARRPRMAAVRAAIGADGLRIVTLLRLTPLVPFNALNYLLGVTPIRFRDFALATFLGMLPGTALNCWTFAALADLGASLGGELPPDPLGTWGLVLRIALAVVATAWITRSARRQLSGRV